MYRRLFASPRLGTKGTDLLKMSDTSFGFLVNRAILVQYSYKYPKTCFGSNMLTNTEV